MNKRLFIIFLLGFSSGLPLALLSGTLQAWYADAGMSVLATGMLSLVSLPYAYRIAWGPLLDRYSLFSLGKRRSWMLVMQVALFLGFNALAWFNPHTSSELMAILAFILACFSATQDVAIDAHRVEYLPTSEHALGASMAVFGYRLALLLAGGLALVLAQHCGWAFTYRLMGFLMLPGVIATLWSKEPSEELIEQVSFLKSFIAPVKDLFSRRGIVFLLCFIFFFKLGEAFTTTTSGIVMPFLIQGLGFSLDTIGYVNKIIGISSTLLGGLVAGLVLLRYSLFSSLLAFGLIQAISNVLFIALAVLGKNLTLFALAAVCDNFAAGMGTTALVALFMRLVNKSFTGTQFSLLVAISSLPRIFSGPFAAMMQMQLGWVGLYQLSFILALGFIPFLLLIKEQIKTADETIFADAEDVSVVQ
ncbi:AmpG family muropeptide MFS transporter [Legionella jordanis]|uniref:Beta lactamase induction signal transducer AmpG n=1 Tax=Legionella jordanis TaxID=456 RepID=A0A0W0VFP9_9GAMM|nr:MFS transporter [Legionella jordanis]KTD18935.1 beta lactamase induction signal transducer AmpG [Legionella jordanis]RMX05501.1 MFS transporter [Legionella jordanis]RMX19186.1 MFS transporter [Legionella jordanis]VEH13035.1 beta lactamase induction signal transducer AmpG [Legionella jordanis]HAT8714078.1 MFS transporter [Legionella jordanis]